MERNKKDDQTKFRYKHTILFFQCNKLSEVSTRPQNFGSDQNQPQLIISAKKNANENQATFSIVRPILV